MVALEQAKTLFLNVEDRIESAQELRPAIGTGRCVLVNRLPLRNRVTKPVVEIKTHCSRDTRRVLYIVLCTLDKLGGSRECMRRARGRHVF